MTLTVSNASRLGISTTGTPSGDKSSRLATASPVTRVRSDNRKTVTSTSRWDRQRAMTYPSPPLFPRPAMTPTLRAAMSGNSSVRNAAAPRPAFSIRILPGRPKDSIVLRSIACISLAVTRYMSALPMMAINLKRSDKPPHFAHRLLKPDQDRSGDDAVADRKRADFLEPFKRADRVEADTTAGLNAYF